MRFSKIVELTAGAVDPNLFLELPARIDPAWITEALTVTGTLPVRKRKLPAEVVVWTVVGACLFGVQSFMDVLRDYELTAPTRRGAQQTPATSGALSRARKRLGAKAFRELNRKAAQTWLNHASVADHRYRGLRVLAVDGTTFDLPDTASNNREFGKPKVGDGVPEPAFPKARAVVVMDTRAHFTLDAEIGGYERTEFDLLETDPDEGLLARLPDSSLTIFDRYYRSWGMLWRLQGKGQERHWILRARADLVAKEVRTLGPGDRLVKIFPGYASRKADPATPAELIVREVTFTRARTTFRILTSLLDAAAYPARELAMLYGERWELELAFDDMKTEQRQAVPTLRSRLSEGVYQEFYALLLAHNVVRFEMARAAAQVGLPPTRISFHVALRTIARHLHGCAVTTAPSRIATREDALRHTLASLILPVRRSSRVYPRALKRIIARYPKKRIGQPQDSS